jgi:hypothetical protein
MLVAVVYYQYRPLPPYPIRWANWYVLVGVGVGVGVMVWLARRRREALSNAERIFVEEERAAPEALPVRSPS